jgi:hypothetical protein
MMPGGGFGGGFLGGALGAALQAAVSGSRRGFSEQYHCYSVAYADKAHLEVRIMFVLIVTWLYVTKSNEIHDVCLFFSR